MTKLVENSFRAVNIAWINEMANLAAQKSVNISEVVELANTKPYGFMKFTPGSGAGGHCIPADPHYLLMESVANTTPITTLAMQEIHRRPVSIANQAAGLLRSKELSQSRVLIWGVAYKPNVSDVRESPALAIIGELLNQGMRVDYHDPLVDEVEVNSIPVLGISEPEFAKYDLIILHTIHDSGVPEQIFELGKEILDTTFKFTNRSRVVTPA
jgi:nucleotide sugar dehydrogenase